MEEELYTYNTPISKGHMANSDSKCLCGGLKHRDAQAHMRIRPFDANTLEVFESVAIISHCDISDMLWVKTALSAVVSCKRCIAIYRKRYLPKTK